jgi:hypothetical protein
MKTKVKAKSSKQPGEWKPTVGDKVRYKTHVSTYTISRISTDGKEADIYISGTEFEIFRVSTDDLKLVEWVK